MIQPQTQRIEPFTQDTFETAAARLEELATNEDPREYVIREEGALTFSLLLDPELTGASSAQCVDARVDVALTWLHEQLGELLVPHILIDWRWSEDVLSRGGLKTRLCGTIV